MRYPVKNFNCHMRGAPIVNGMPGSWLNMIKACLIDGFGEVTAITGVVSNGKCTITFNANESFDKNTVVSISGANLTTINGEQWVEKSDNVSITFKTLEPDQTLVGTIKVKYAPVGNWYMPYFGTNQGVFKSSNPESSGIYFRFDDRQARYVTVNMARNMTSLDEGVGMYPNINSSEIRYFTKSTEANTTAKYWAIFADDTSVYYFNNNNFHLGHTNYATYSVTYLSFFFGDYIEPSAALPGNALIVAETNKEKDPNSSYVTSSGNFSAYLSITSGSSNTCQQKTIYRDLITNQPKNVNSIGNGLSSASDPSVSSRMLDVVFGQFDREIGIIPVTLLTGGLSSLMPGLYFVQAFLPDDFVSNDKKIIKNIKNMPGKELLIYYANHGWTNHSTNYKAFVLFDIKGPWR